jgi:hypothetical protein
MRKPTFRTLIYGLAIIVTLVFIYIDAPFFYQKDNPEPFGFFSDTKSAYQYKYDQCSLNSIGDSTSDSVIFSFGCFSPQWSKYAGVFMYYGNCGHITDFDNHLLGSDFPDYLIEFPFNIKNIGRSCRVDITNNNKFVELTDLKASHFNNLNNTLIVEWTEGPSLNEFMLSGDRIFKDISFDEKSINYYITDQWMRNQNLINNAPNSFIISLKIPKNFEIGNLEQYSFSDETHGTQELGNYITINKDLKQSKVLHLTITDPNKHQIKIVIEGIWTLFIVGIFLDMLLRKMNQQLYG